MFCNQIGPKSIPSVPPGLNFRKDLEFRIKNHPKSLTRAQQWCFLLKIEKRELEHR